MKILSYLPNLQVVCYSWNFNKVTAELWFAKQYFITFQRRAFSTSRPILRVNWPVAINPDRKSVIIKSKVKDVDLYGGISLARSLLDRFTLWRTTGRNDEGVGRQAMTSGESTSPDLPTGCQASRPFSL